MVVIVDYGMGNLSSVKNAALFLSRRIRVSDSGNIIKKAKKIIFPGVGHFAKAVRELKKRQIFNILKEKIKEGVPFLGICLGMQLLLEESREAPGIKGLGVIKGKVKKLSGENLIIPHMGWNTVKVPINHGGQACGAASRQPSEKLFKGVKGSSFFYFAHSYYCQPQEKEVVLTVTDYGDEFVSSLHKENIWAVQFHPEKSQTPGLKVFSNFLNL